MGTAQLDVGVLLQLVDELGELQLPGDDAFLVATMTPSECVAPGAWLQLQTIRQERLSGPTFGCVLYLLAPDSEPIATLTQLANLLDVVRPVVDELGGPTDAIRLTTVQLPDSTRLPALAVPFDIDTE